MAKKKRMFHSVDIRPVGNKHYKVKTTPRPDEHEPGSPPPSIYGGEDPKDEEVFHHGEREKLHKHIDALMDAHEGVKDSPAEEKAEMPADHPMHKLKRRML